MIKILFSDLDGTLLYDQGHDTYPVTIANKEAIQRLQKAGIRFAVATSRSFYFLNQLMEEADFDTVAFNGNQVWADKKMMDCAHFTRQEIEKICDYTHAYSKETRIFFVNQDNDLLFVDIQMPMVQGYIENRLGKYQDHREILEVSILDYKKEDIQAILCTYASQEAADAARKRLEGYSEITVINTGERTFTLTKENRTKVSGIKKIAKFYGIKDDEVAVIGDSYNDIAMFEHFSCSFCMRHAKPEIQQKACKIVDSVSEAIDILLSSHSSL